MYIGEITLKLLLSILFGGAVGLERETSRKPAGLRTNILICASSTMMMALSQLQIGGKDLSGEAMRMAAGVITGVGFLGAGAIIQSRGAVHGLTTASTIWAVAGMGLILGAGYYLLAAIFTAVIVITLIVLRKVEGFIARKKGWPPIPEN
jgi:putative Mg2+ transporter-C (MgtC) family protein